MDNQQPKPSKQDGMPEAVASVTYSLITPNEFPILFTVRGTSGTELLETMTTVEGMLKIKGFKPQPLRQGGFPPKKEIEYVEGRLCPLCGEKLVYAIKKADGSKFIKCSTQKYDFATKTSSGCNFVEWPKTT